MTDHQTENDSFLRICDEIEDKRADGESIDIEDYVERYPEYAGRIREIFEDLPAMFDNIQSSSGRASQRIPPEHLKNRVLGDFRIVERIASGGMGDVFKARQISLDRTVALKTLPFAALDSNRLERFKREVKAVAKFKHPNIVPIHSYGEQSGFHYFTMHFIEGITLSTLIDELRKFKEDHETTSDSKTSNCASVLTTKRNSPNEYFRAIARIGEQVANSLDHAHTAGIVHRDIKPKNIMIEENGHVWLTDFGLAVIHGEHDQTKTGDVVGTLPYMSPEQFEASPDQVDYRSDIYSLGVTLYELLALSPAFEARENRSYQSLIVDNNYKSLRQSDSTIPIDLETIVQKAMEKDPRSRYGNSRAMADDLKRFIEQRPILAKPPTTWQMLRKWMSRNRRWIVPWSGLFVVVLILLFIVGNVIADRNRRNLRENLVSRFQMMLLTTHKNGWSDKAWDLAKNSAAIEASDDVRSLALAACRGYDAFVVRECRLYGAKVVRFFADNKRLLIGPTIHEKRQDGAHPNKREVGSYRIWNLANGQDNQIVTSTHGPVRLNGNTPIRIVFDNDRFSFFDLNSNKVSGEESTFPGDLKPLTDIAPVFSNDHSVVVFIAQATGQGNVAVIWKNGRVLERVEPVKSKISAIAVTPSGGLVAVASTTGKIQVWSISDSANLKFELDDEHTGVRCLEFARNFRSTALKETWLLSAGSNGGTTTIWDVAKQKPIAFCRGNRFEVLSIAFSPDASLVAAGGRGPVRLYDSSTGEPLIEISTGDFINDLDDGSHFATSSRVSKTENARFDISHFLCGRMVGFA